MEEVIINASLKATFDVLESGDPEGPDLAGTLVEPDFRPEAN
jgi:hypothetical protein